MGKIPFAPLDASKLVVHLVASAPAPLESVPVCYLERFLFPTGSDLGPSLGPSPMDPSVHLCAGSPAEAGSVWNLDSLTCPELEFFLFSAPSCTLHSCLVSPCSLHPPDSVPHDLSLFSPVRPHVTCLSSLHRLPLVGGGLGEEAPLNEAERRREGQRLEMVYNTT